MTRRRVVVGIGSRANWGSGERVCAALRDRCGLTVVTYASALLDRYGRVSQDIAMSGYDVLEVPCLVEGGRPRDMAMTCSLAMSGLAAAFERLRPEVVYVIGDRYEVLPLAYTGALMNCVVAHQMGGELSGTIDESIRHAITKLSHWHFVATNEAGMRVEGLGERPEQVFVTGCPRIDALTKSTPYTGPDMVMVSQHSVTTEWLDAGRQMRATLDGVRLAWDGPVHLFWPNADAGCELVIDAVRDSGVELHTHRNVTPAVYNGMLAAARCVVGNSSSAIREGAYLGTPAVNVGSRQSWRERGPNVVDVRHDPEHIAEAVKRQLKANRLRSTLYGDGLAAERIAEVICEAKLPQVQKAWAL